MINFLDLLKDTNAYATVKSDKAANRLSHAYLILSVDKAFIGEYVKLFAKLIMISGEDARAERLIEEGVHPDVLTFPAKGDALLKEDVSAIIAESYVKPVESDRKLFIILNGQSMNASSQNKLLKTLEEPPANVHILIGATSEFSLLSTFKSRLKRLVIPAFSDERLFFALSPDCPDEERLKEAISCGDGTAGKAFALYGDENLSETTDAVADVLTNMQSSTKVAEYSEKIVGLKDGFAGFLEVLELANRDLTAYYAAGEKAVKNSRLFARIKDAKGFSVGATVAIADKIAEAGRRLNANGNPQSVAEWLLFSILEVKHKWQKW